MGNPTSDGKFGEYSRKHDCPRPLAGCRYPKCSCDVDELERSYVEMKAEDAANPDSE